MGKSKARTKTSKINECRELIINNFLSYAFHVHGWEVKKEDDFDDLVEAFNEILEKYIE